MGMKKILLIDYDQNSLASLRAIFTEQGYQVVTAADGQAGWDKYNKECPDLVLMEAMLPKVHGFELCQRITSERNSQATVFIMTGVYKDRVYRTEALRTYGASEYFEKPLKMAELLGSVEALLGKPEPRPVVARPAVEAAAPVESRKHGRPRIDDSIFSLPDDLDRLSRENPKIRKPVPSPARREADAEASLDALAEDLLKSVIVETTTPKMVEPKASDGNGNGGASADIDQFLKSALAGLDLKKEKIKAPKPAPPARVELKTKPEPSPEPKPTPPPAPRPDHFFSPPEKDMKNTLTPGDPGSDISPFFSPGKPKPEPPAERPKIRAAFASPAPAVAVPKPLEPAARPDRKTAPEAVRKEPARQEPERHEAPPPHPAPGHPHQEIKRPDVLPTASGDIFRDVVEVKERKGFPTLAAVAIGVLAVAAVGFFLLRPKRASQTMGTPPPPMETVQKSESPAQPTEEVTPPESKSEPKPESKPAPVKQKPQAEPAKAVPAGADAILPAGPPPADLPAIKAPIGGRTVQGSANTASRPRPSDPPASKMEAPPLTAETETNAAGNPAQNAEAGTGVIPEAPAAAPLTISIPEESPVNEGDLIELSAVTEPPQLIKQVDPVYPQTAQRLGISGSITVNALIDEKGNVIDTGILKGIQDDMGLARAAQNAVKKWKFEPARKNGVAVKVWKPFVIVFKAEVSPANMSR
jgi:TonB family protein